jgi:hypothetical protein
VLLLETQKLARIISESLLVSGDNGYSLALIYYNAVREAARPSANMPGARVIFDRLRTFFSSRSRTTAAEPTEKETLRDVKALLHGHKDGKIVIENEKPHLVGGKHLVADETGKPKGAWKETEEGEING